MIPSKNLSEIFRLNEDQKKALKKLGLTTTIDLLYHFPDHYGDTAEFKNISTLTAGEKAVIFGKISGLKTSKGFRSKIPMADGIIEDSTGKIKAVWFNQPYLAKMIAEDSQIRVEGKVSQRKKTGELYFSNPKIESVNKLPIGTGESLFGEKEQEHILYPVYPESRGITSNWFYHSIQKIFRSDFFEGLDDPIPDEILNKYHLPTIKTALIFIHSPKRKSDAETARKRFSFEEVFFIQLQKQKEKQLWKKQKSFEIDKADTHIKEFTDRFPFALTSAQKKSTDAIVDDFRRGNPMSRLLEGDVGSGKTAVAASSAYAVVTSKPAGQNFGTLQVAYMAPTEILASQHFESFIEYFKHLPINIALITGTGCKKFPSKVNPAGWTDISRSQLLKWVGNGEISILIGTHALIQKTVKFKHLAYVIIDEQHRFGVNQRKALLHKGGLIPHLLSMTATPIPRTLALTIYGDLDLSVLDEQPPGRKAIITEIVLPGKRKEVYEKIRKLLEEGRQCYIITPRINEPDPNKELAVLTKSVKAEALRLKKEIFPDYKIAVLHSKLKPAEKDRVMLDFKNGLTNILVSTSVVEVGVNVPNATAIIIEGAERFGLAQLHQLRGRVLRSTHQAHCFVFAEGGGPKTTDRLKALCTAKNGFELAEYDLKFRGPGELSGAHQWGVSDIAMEALKNIKMVEAARNEAREIIEKDETLLFFPTIKTELDRRESDQLHLE